MIIIDGSYGEGGGQILRTALPFSIITQQPVKIINIRAKRPEPGLKRQHLAVVKILKKISDAEVEGAFLGSTELTFIPKKLKYKDLEFDIGSAGSIPLVIQSLAILSCIIEKPIKIKIIGGTDVKHAPSIDYMKYVFSEALSKLGIKININVIKRGFYPKGGGIVEITLYPSKIIEKYEFIEDYSKENLKINCWIVATKDLKNRNVAGRILSSIKKYINLEDYEIHYVDALSTGVIATIRAINEKVILGADQLGEKGLRSEDLGKLLVQKLNKELEAKACVDQHLADMLIPFGFLMKSLKFKTSEFTKHLLTNIWVCNQFLNKDIKIDKENKIIEIL